MIMGSKPVACCLTYQQKGVKNIFMNAGNSKFPKCERGYFLDYLYWTFQCVCTYDIGVYDLGLPTTGRSMCLYPTNQNEVKFNTCRTMFIVSSLVYNQKLIISILWKKKFSLQHIILSIYLSWRTSCHCAEYWIYWKYGAKSCVWPTMKLDLFSLSWMLYPQPLVLFSLYVY